MKYRSYRIVNGKPIWVIVDENGDIINRTPSKDELKSLKTETPGYKKRQVYSNEKLLNYLKQFLEENRRIPITRDFENNPEYPGHKIYQIRFGSWNKALEMAGFDISKKEKKKIYTDEELLNYLKVFYQENGRVPTQRDFVNNSEYPGIMTYVRRFENLEVALGKIGLDLDTRVRQNHLKTNIEKGRYIELMVREMFDNKGIDLSGENWGSYLDGICPDSQTYEVKSSKLNIERYFDFSTQNKDKGDNIEAIQWYYFAAMTKDYTKLIYMWRVPGEIVEKAHFIVGLHGSYEFNTESMKEYDITEKFKKIITDKNDDILSKLIN